LMKKKLKKLWVC